MNVRTLCLGVLQFGEATGYEIKKTVEEGMFNHFIEASYGSIYPALTRMADEGLVTLRQETQSGRPDKKIYAITPAGSAELVRTLSAVPGPDKFKSEFLFVMLLADRLPREHISRVYEGRLADLRAELEELRSCAAECQHQGSRFVVGYGLAVYEASVRYLESQRNAFCEADTDSAQQRTIAASAAE